MAGIANSSTAVAEESPGNTFSQVGMIGLFMALQLCQFTQPYGSLLFKNFGGSFWRCNPISSFTEACMIFIYLSQTLSGSPRPGQTRWLVKLRQTAGSLLLIRATNADEDGAMLFEALLDEDAEALQPLQIPDSSMGYRIGGTEAAGYTFGDVSAAPTSPVAYHRSLQSETRAINDEEAANPSLSSKTAKKINGAFSSNALARRDLRTDVFGIIAELCIVIKLLAITGNVLFRMTCLLLIFGWAALQSLLLLFHSKEIEENELRNTLRLARRYQRGLSQRRLRWRSFYIILHIPFFGYLSYLACFHTWINSKSTKLILLMRSFALIPRIGLILLLHLITIISIMSMITSDAPLLDFISLGEYPTARILLNIALAVLAITGISWFGFASLSYIIQYVGMIEGEFEGFFGFEGFFKSGTFLNVLVDRGYIVFQQWLSWLLLSLFLTLTYVVLTVPGGSRWYMSTFSWDDISFLAYLANRMPQRWAPVLNAIVVFATLIVYVVRHKEGNSWVPGWTDVLG